MNRKWTFGFMLFAFIGFGGLIGCGGGTAVGGSSTSSENLTFEAWQGYRSGSLADSEKLFEDALSVDSQNSEAYNGLGWLNFQKAGQEENKEQREGILQKSRDSFQKATASNPENVDAWVGLSGLELHLGNWTDARDAANRALSLDPRYFSTHDNIDFRDIHLILAEAFFFLGAFIHTEISPDPNNSLHRLDAIAPGYKALYHDNNLTPPDLVTKIGELQGL